jgi:lysophospholipase L1-like esterase
MNRGPAALMALIAAAAVGAVGVGVTWVTTAGPLRGGAPGQVAALAESTDGTDIAGSTPGSGPIRTASIGPAAGDGDLVGALGRDYDPDGRPTGGAGRGTTILQIGDGHTSADFFTGALRKALQARYGDGGPGYVTAGHPRAGIRSATLNITSSSGWTYKALQRSDNSSEFWLSGFNAVAVTEGQTMSFSATRPITFDMIEIEVVRRPGGGAIDIRLDGAVESAFDLDAPEVDPVVIRLMPNRGATDRVKQISIVTTRAGTVNVASVAIYNRRSGVTYNSVGYPDATVGIVNKFDEKLFASELRRIDPQIVVLAFGSNEGLNEKLDLDRYSNNYERAVQKIKTALPSASIVVVAPPDSNELPTNCRDKTMPGQCQGTATARPASLPGISDAARAQDPGECVWRTPPKLNRVRDIQRDIAQREGLVYWDWASIMPQECGADRWASQSPPLIAKDRLHFTRSGYELSAEQFAKALIPVIERVRASANAVSN